MSIAEIEELDGIIIIKIFGALNAKVIGEFDEMSDSVLRKKPEVLALDCSKLDFIDSVGINHLFRLSQRSSEEEIRFILYDLNPTIKQIFQVTNLDKLLNVVTRETFESEFIID